MWINVTQHYCKSLNQILEYEAYLTECLNCFMCKVVEEELDKIEEVDKRISVFKNLLDSYNNRTCAVSKLISSSGDLLEYCDYKCYSKEGYCDNILDKIADDCEVYDVNCVSKCITGSPCKSGCGPCNRRRSICANKPDCGPRCACGCGDKCGCKCDRECRCKCGCDGKCTCGCKELVKRGPQDRYGYSEKVDCDMDYMSGYDRREKKCHEREFRNNPFESMRDDYYGCRKPYENGYECRKPYENDCECRKSINIKDLIKGGKGIDCDALGLECFKAPFGKVCGENIDGKHLGNGVYYLGKVRIADSCNNTCMCKHMLYDTKNGKLYFCKANNNKNVSVTYWV